MIRGELTAAEEFRCNRILFRLAGQAGADALDGSAEDDAALADLVTLGYAFRDGRTPVIADAGWGRLELLRLWDEVPRGVVTATAVVAGSTLWRWRDGFGGRRARLGVFRRAAGVFDYAEAFAPVGCSGRVACLTVADAISAAADRLLWLDAAERGAL